MSPSFSTSAIAENQAEERSRSFSSQRRRTHRDPAAELAGTMVEPGALAGGGVRIPRFLTSQIGQKWTEILAELWSATGSDAEFHRILHGLLEYVETTVLGTCNQPRHGSGLMAGQPLTAGWRRRLYVCPDSNRLKWIPSSGIPENLSADEFSKQQTVGRLRK